MRLLSFQWQTPEEHLAADELLLETAEREGAEDALWFWEPRTRFVVLGYANECEREADTQYCARHGIPLLRRCTGGGAVVQGPGCLNYSLVLSMRAHPALETITSTNHYIMGRHRAALAGLLNRPVELAGHTDLAIEGRKFSGNSQRRRKEFVLFHGCFLLNTDLEFMERCLRMPSRQPHYRRGRTHRDFVMNLELDAEVVRGCLAAAWSARPEIGGIPAWEVRKLAVEKYSSAAWNLRF